MTFLDRLNYFIEEADSDNFEIIKNAFTGPAAKLWQKIYALKDYLPDEPSNKYWIAIKPKLIEFITELQRYTKPLRAIGHDNEIISIFAQTPKDIGKLKGEEISRLIYKLGNYKFYYNRLKEQFGISKSLSNPTKHWLQLWKSDKLWSLPPKNIEYELKNYVSATPITVYRGIRFNDKIKMAKKGQIFNLKSKKLTSYSYSKERAERFATHLPAESIGVGMFLWFEQIKTGKSFQGRGGFVVEAIISPEQQLVDFTKLPNFWHTHGTEGEVVALPNTTIKAKVIKVIK